MAAPAPRAPAPAAPEPIPPAARAPTPASGPDEVSSAVTGAIRVEETAAPPAPADPRALLGGRVVLLDLPKDKVEIDLAVVPIGGGFRGFQVVPAGVHRIAVRDGSSVVTDWLRVEAGGVVVRAFDADRGAFGNPDPERAREIVTLAASGAMNRALAVYPMEIRWEWESLAAPLAAVPFPIEIHASDPPGRTRIEAALLGTHRGKGEAFLAEVALSFLRGLVDQQRPALARWLHLFDAACHCGESTPRQDPPTWVKLCHLVAAQMKLADKMQLERPPHLRYLVEDLEDGGVPELVAAGKSLRAALGI